MHYFEYMLGSTRGLAQGYINGLLQAIEDLVYESIVVSLGDRRIQWDVDIRHDTMHMNANLLSIRHTSEYPDDRHLKQSSGVKRSLRDDNYLPASPDCLGISSNSDPSRKSVHFGSDRRK